jgi:hypothetical protein
MLPLTHSAAHREDLGTAKKRKIPLFFAVIEALFHGIPLHILVTIPTELP